MEKSKYECLREAAANSGIENELPPIKPGTEVSEGPREIDAYTPPLNDYAQFHYEAIDGTGKGVIVTDGLRRQPDGSYESEKAFSILTQDQTKPLGPENPTVNRITSVELTSGTERTALGAPPKAGTVASTADKFFGCRTLPLS